MILTVIFNIPWSGIPLMESLYAIISSGVNWVQHPVRVSPCAGWGTLIWLQRQDHSANTLIVSAGAPLHSIPRSAASPTLTIGSSKSEPSSRSSSESSLSTDVDSGTSEVAIVSGSVSSLWSSVSSSSRSGSVWVKYSLMRSRTPSLSKSKIFPDLEEFSNATIRFAMIACRSRHSHTRSSRDDRVKVRLVNALVRLLANHWTPCNRAVVSSPRDFFQSASDWFNSLALFYTKRCCYTRFYWIILNSCVKNSNLEIVTFIPVCNTWGSVWVTRNKCAVKMGHFGMFFPS